MKIRIKDITENPISLLRRAGYVFQRTEGQEHSFVRIFSQSGYPRFHCYASVSGLDLVLSLHLDQKKHTYGAVTRHHGEYENTGLMKEETRRLLQLFGENAHII